MNEYSGRDNLASMEHAANYNQYLLSLVLKSARKGNLIVDFGAGNGLFAHSVAAAGHKVICVEIDPALSADLTYRGMTVINDLEKIKDSSIDYIYSLNVLEHIKDDTGVIALWHRKLRFGGKLMVYVPACQLLFTSMDRKVGHFRRYNIKELTGKLSEYKFEIMISRHVDSVGFLATLIYKWINPSDGSLNPDMVRFYDRWIFPFSSLIDPLLNSFMGKNLYVVAKKK